MTMNKEDAGFLTGNITVSTSLCDSRGSGSDVIVTCDPIEGSFVSSADEISSWNVFTGKSDPTNMKDEAQEGEPFLS